MASEHEVLYAAASSSFGLLVRGSAKALRKVRGTLSNDLALGDLVVLGPDERGEVWIIRRSAIREHLIGGESDVC